LDLRATETCEFLRQELAPVLVRLGLSDFDVSGARRPSRALTQAIARWAFDRSYHGIAYKSRFSDALDCRALFEGAAFEREGQSDRLAPKLSRSPASAGTRRLVADRGTAGAAPAPDGSLLILAPPGAGKRRGSDVAARFAHCQELGGRVRHARKEPCPALGHRTTSDDAMRPTGDEVTAGGGFPSSPRSALDAGSASWHSVY
jgi:hypothetical protein